MTFQHKFSLAWNSNRTGTSVAAYHTLRQMRTLSLVMVILCQFVLFPAYSGYAHRLPASLTGLNTYNDNHLGPALNSSTRENPNAGNKKLYANAAFPLDALFNSTDSTSRENAHLPLIAQGTGGTEMSDTIYVSSARELLSALASANGGETILLKAGDYGSLDLYSGRQDFVKFDSEVTIKSADPNDLAKFSSVKLSGVENLTFDTIKLDYNADVGAPEYEKPFSVRDSANITITNSLFDGDTAEGVSDAVDGYPTGHALAVFSSSNIVVQGNEFQTFMRAGIFSGIDGLVVKDNDIHDIRSDGLDFADVDNVVIEGNHLHDFVAAVNSTDHSDMIQFWTAGTTSPSENILINGNILDSANGAATQSIFMRNDMVDTGKAGAEMFYQNVTIENNIIYNGSTHGISVGETDGLTIQNNTILQNPDSGSANLVTVPTIHISSSATGVTVSNNIIPRLALDASASQNWTVDNNLIVQNTDPNLPNYVGDLFVNAMTGGDATLSDLQALPNGVIEQMGVGAALTTYGSDPDASVGSIHVDSGTGLDLMKQTFSLSDAMESGQYVDLTDAKVTWDFGDDSQVSSTAEHTYAHAGTYDVTATISLPDGLTMNVVKAIKVETPIALFSDFDNGSADLSDTVNAVSVGNSVTYEPHGDGQAVRLNGDVVKYAASADLFNNSEFTVMVDFKHDAGHESDSGRIVSMSGAISVFVDGSKLAVSVTTDQGAVWLRPQNVNIGDADWHSLAVTFSGKTGELALYLDSQQVALATGLEGAVQGHTSSAMYVGDPWGAGISGLIDNFAFLKGALTADQIAGGTGSEILHELMTPTNTDVTDTTTSDPGAGTDTDTGSSGSTDTNLSMSDTDPNVIHGTDGNDVLSGTAGADDIYGDGGRDHISAGDGNDIVHLGDSNWGRADGGNGDDTLYGRNANDTLFGDAGNDILNGGDGSDKLFGGDGNDQLFGGTGRDWLYGEGGDDVLVSGDANYNTLDGGDGNDQLYGGAQRDYLFGGAGNDVLVGGGGKDSLTGGDGADQFVFSHGSGADTILDFNASDDIIILKALGFATVADVLAAATEANGNLTLHLDAPGMDFSWSNSDYVCLVGVNANDLTDANFCLVS